LINFSMKIGIIFFPSEFFCIPWSFIFCLISNRWHFISCEIVLNLSLSTRVEYSERHLNNNFFNKILFFSKQTPNLHSILFSKQLWFKQKKLLLWTNYHFSSWEIYLTLCSSLGVDYFKKQSKLSKFSNKYFILLFKEIHHYYFIPFILT
jgi:hypothetical protein